MTSDLREHLQASLGGMYTVERELHGGGMSRAFVATEATLGRRVVLKVLPPEFTAELSAERFRREIQFAASLQHPHIIPILAAGEAGTLLYYSMPLIEGESLRDRLRSEKQLAIDDAVRIAREVADALDCAHRHGVVHRDIKPENILLEDGHAVVADFGIARAVSRASDSGTLTGTGMTIGTPAYMSPEQAAGEKEVDGRTDIYSLGCVLYEMLSGEPPFTGPTAQAGLARRFTGPPPNPCLARPSVPTGIGEAVVRALAVVPADRFRTAHEFGEALALPGGGAMREARRERTDRFARRVWPRVLAALGALAVVGAVVGLVALRRRTPPGAATLDPRVVAVIPFRVAGADSALEYLHEGMIDLLAAKLTGDGGPRAVDPRTMVSAWRQAGSTGRGDLPEEVALEVARHLGAGQLLLGSIIGTPARLMMTASLLHVRNASARVEASAQGPADSLPAVVDRLAAQLLAGEAGETERLAGLTSTSLPALRSYLTGESEYRQGRYEQAVQHFERALQLDSGFALAAIGLFTAAYWTPNTEPFLRGQRLAWLARNRLSARDRVFLLAWTGPRFPAPASYDEILSGWQRAVEAAPDRPEPWFEWGDAIFHFGPLVGLAVPNQRATAAFRRAVALDSGFSAPLGHLVELAAIGHDTAEARRLAALYFTRDSAADVADYVRWRTATAIGDDSTLMALRRRFDEISTVSLRRILGIGQLVGVGLSDVRRTASVLRSLAATPSERQLIYFDLRNFALNSGRPRDAQAMAELYREVEPYRGASLDLAILDGLYGDGDSTAAARAAQLLAVQVDAPLAGDADARHAQLHHTCAVELWRLAHGDVGGIAPVIARLERTESPEGSSIVEIDHRICAATIAALGALARGSPDADVVEGLERALNRTGPATFGGGPVENIGRLVLARVCVARGDLAGALAVLRRRAYHHLAVTYLAASLREEGQLAAQSGDVPGARAAYRHYLALRADPEPALRGDAERIRDQLARLGH